MNSLVVGKLFLFIPGLRSSSEYEFRAVVDHQFGSGPPSEIAYVTTHPDPGESYRHLYLDTDITYTYTHI